MRYVWPVILWVGCGWSEERLLTEGLDEWCTEATACEGGYTIDACIDHIRTVDRSLCDYDPEAARACIADLPSATCTDLPALDTASFNSPESCDEIWEGCGPLFPEPISPGTSPSDPTP